MLRELESLILKAIRALNGYAYGVTIQRHLREANKGRETSYGALYKALDRLEQHGYVTSRLGEATPERGNRPKRLYRIEESGRLAMDTLEAAQKAPPVAGREMYAR